MNRLPKEIKKDLKEEAKEWDRTIAKESPEHVQKMLDQAEFFKIPRPPRQPVSIRLDPFDIAMVKRIARRKGIPPTQLMATWLHERIEREKGVSPN
jgi:predicted DNA binding CopG/RHH family protein